MPVHFIVGMDFVSESDQAWMQHRVEHGGRRCPHVVANTKVTVIGRAFELDVDQTTSSPTITPSGDVGTIDSVQDEIAEIKQVMKTDRKKYDGDERMQERYRELLSALEKDQSRRGAAA